MLYYRKVAKIEKKNPLNADLLVSCTALMAAADQFSPTVQALNRGYEITAKAPLKEAGKEAIQAEKQRWHYHSHA